MRRLPGGVFQTVGVARERCFGLALRRTGEERALGHCWDLGALQHACDCVALCGQPRFRAYARSPAREAVPSVFRCPRNYVRARSGFCLTAACAALGLFVGRYPFLMVAGFSARVARAWGLALPGAEVGFVCVAEKSSIVEAGGVASPRFMSVDLLHPTSGLAVLMQRCSAFAPVSELVCPECLEEPISVPISHKNEMREHWQFMISAHFVLHCWVTSLSHSLGAFS